MTVILLLFLSAQIPQIILPKPAISITVPAKQVQLTPSISIEKPNLMMNKVIPILPEPRITITTPEFSKSIPKPFPTVSAPAEY